MSLFEKVKNIRRNNLQEKRKFPGDESGAYKRAKDDLEARKGFSKNKPGGLKADEKNPFVKRSVRKTRVDKLGGDIYDAPKFSQKKFDKSIGGAKKPTSPAAPGLFGKGDTKGQMNVKGMEKKAFKKTQPSDIKLPKSFTDFQRNLQDYKDRDQPGGPRKSPTKSKTSGTPLTRQDVGMAPPNKPKTKGVKQSEVSKKAQEFTKKTNQARVEKISKPKVTTSKVPAPNNLFNRVKPKGDGKVKNSKGIGNKYRGNSPEAKALRQQAIDARSGKPQSSSSSSNIVKSNRVTSSDRPNRGYQNQIQTKGSDRVTVNKTYGPRNQFKKLKSSKVSFEIPGAKGPSSMKDVKLPQFSKAESPSFKLSPKGQKFASKIPKALRGKTAAKIGKAALKVPGLSAVAGVGLAAAAGYGAYKAFKNFNKKKDLTYKDFRSLSTPSDPNKGKIIHTRDIPKMNIKKGDVARFSSSSKIPKSSSAEFKSNYAYK